MKALPTLLLLFTALQLGRAAPALEPLTCSQDSGAAAARLAMYHIDDHHDHGYKFRLNEIQGNKVEKVDEGCNIQLQLHLLETKCHTVSPKHFEDCEIRGEHDRAVMANCTVIMTVKNSTAKVIRYDCDTQQVITDVEMVKKCPDCPKLIPLNNPEGLKSVNDAVKKFNENTTNQHYYILQEVGRIKSGYMMTAGMGYFAEFVLVETRCPRGSRIIPEACKPLCPDRAHHAVCRSSYTTENGLGSVECEFYPPVNTTALGPGEQEPVCRPLHPAGHPHPPGSSSHAGQGPPPHSHGHRPPHHSHSQGPPHHSHSQGPPHHSHSQGPPPHSHSQGPPPHSHSQGPPPHSHSQGPPPGQERLQHKHPFNSHRHFHRCHGFLTNIDPALHPICPWPRPEPHSKPKMGQS